MMLAEKFIGQNVTGWWMSEKLDGCRAFWDGQCLRTRSWLRVDAPDWFTASLPKGKSLDGELWMGRQTFQKMRVLVQFPRASSDQWRRVKFMVFDAPNTDSVSFEDRQARARRRTRGEFCEMVAQSRAASVLDAYAAFRKVVQAGGEGLVLRKPGHFYDFGYSANWLKMKPAGVD